MVINAILWIERTGALWRDLPRERYGPWETIYGWYNRWSKHELGVPLSLEMASMEEFLIGVVGRVMYWWGYMHIPISAWPQWRRRWKFFRSREAVPLSSWVELCGGKPEWDPELVQRVLEAIGLLLVDARQVRPEDRFDRELAIPSRFMDNFQVFREGMAQILYEGRSIPPGAEAVDWQASTTVAETIDYLNKIWTKYPKRAR